MTDNNSLVNWTRGNSGFTRIRFGFFIVRFGFNWVNSWFTGNFNFQLGLGDRPGFLHLREAKDFRLRTWSFLLSSVTTLKFMFSVG